MSPAETTTITPVSHFAARSAINFKMTGDIFVYLEGSGRFLPIRSQILAVAAPVVINRGRRKREEQKDESTFKIHTHKER